MVWAWGVFPSAAPALVLSRHCEPGVGVPMGLVPPDSIAYPLPSICGGVLDGRVSPISPPETAEFCFRSVQDPVSSPVSLLPLPHGWMALLLLYLLHWSTFAWDWGGGFCPSPGRSGLCLIEVKWMPGYHQGRWLSRFLTLTQLFSCDFPSGKPWKRACE